ncbi:cilia- and flagella-associated protein 161 [Drosophila gunungcola]|uniref:cilia- and flagella-associated protein 161 n=1 Tax=Drosophila gunungcola TaxID=103775 RepID=UPI0022E5BF1D|nr:cilia- and flagella-associated protein 161 [Drosophila gunungcola]XP_052858889.1 cilia- and flagella-associated protein 161 [Drosophila gunungcola]
MYGPGVRVGNWLEAALSEEMRVSEMKKRRDSGNLLLDRTRAVYDRFYQETVLGPPQDVLAFGVVVQLQPVKISVCRQQDIDQNLVLSVVITQEGLHRNCNTINEMCDLTVAPSPRPSLRNSFRIVSPNEKDLTGQYLAYGEKFRLQTLEPADEPMYVFSGPKRLNLSLPVEKVFFTTKNGEVTLPLGLVSYKNCGQSARVPTSHTHFFCAHESPDHRFESEGKTIPVNKPLVIVHAATNRNLAVENVLANTLFGPEFQVSVQTYKNVYKRETWKNQWMFTY